MKRFSSAGLLLLPCVLLLLVRCGKAGDTQGPGAACPAYAAGGLEASCLDFRGVAYVVLRVDLKAARVGLLWKNRAGIPYGSLDEAARQAGGGLLALTNAGIYSDRHTPEGLHVEGGVTLSPLNLDGGGGNFYWRPNGVFYVADGGAGIVESGKFGAPGGPTGVREATQSGPLLVIDGELNPDFKPDSRSLNVRNGVGVASPEEVYVVVSRDEVNLYDFASLFRERLRCRQALYLDGCVSQVYLPARGARVPERRRCEKELVGMLAVFSR